MSDVKGEDTACRNDGQEPRRAWKVLRQLPEERLAKRRWHLPSPRKRCSGSERRRCRLRKLPPKFDARERPGRPLGAAARREPRKEASIRNRRRIRRRGLPMRTVYLEVRLVWRFASDEDLHEAIRNSFRRLYDLAQWAVDREMLKELDLI